MEPRLVANQQGTLVTVATPSKEAAYEVTSPTAEFRTFSGSSRRSSIRVSPLVERDEQDSREPQAPATPIQQSSGDRDEDLLNLTPWGNTDMGSPTTPYFLAKGASLVQQTCPPKQLGQPLFPLSGRIEDQPDQSLRQKLMIARRKSLQWAPKIKSPLGRNVSYGDFGTRKFE